MFKEVVQIQPKVSPSDLSAMERALNSRFAKVSKKFGKGLLGAITGGGLAGLGLGLIDKLLNPLKETQEAIARTLAQADDLTTNAEQFGTTSGRLARLQAFGQATGLDASSLNMLIEKFQASIAEAAADPTKETAVRKFVGERDTASAFFEFIQSLQSMQRNDQVRVQQEVFGEKQILKMADFLRADFGELSQKLGGPSSGQLTPVIDRAAGLNDYKDLVKARMDLIDLQKKSGIITKDMITLNAEAEQRAIDKENANIQGYKDLANISKGADEILKLLNDGLLKLAEMGSKVTDMAVTAKDMSVSRIFRGLVNKQLGGKF